MILVSDKPRTELASELNRYCHYVVPRKLPNSIQSFVAAVAEEGERFFLHGANNTTDQFVQCTLEEIAA